MEICSFCLKQLDLENECYVKDSDFKIYYHSKCFDKKKDWKRGFHEMTKIRCIIYEKEFDHKMSVFITLVRCPFCKNLVRFSFGFIGLSFDTGVECEDGWHEIIYEKDRKTRKTL
jgi:hypothetical protein